VAGRGRDRHAARPGRRIRLCRHRHGDGSGLIDARLASFTLAVTAVTMALTPGLSFAARRFGSWLRAGRPVAAELTARPSAGNKHAIVVGYGRVGKVVCALLKEHGIPFIAADSDALTVTHDRRDGHDVYYGDAADPKFLDDLRSCAMRPASSSPSTPKP
jgi:CPA2 family monovalent cation:H+ antiporter-2